MPIEFKELSYVYDEGMPFAHHALNKIDLAIEEGIVTAIVGKTGSGKSTMIEHLNALLLPSEGSLKILDHTIIAKEKNTNLKALRQKVGLVFQFSEYQLFEETIIKDVSFGPKNFGASEEEAVLKAKEALKLVGLDESYYERSPLNLSGGQKRRVAIAGILAMDPSIIVLDEPTAGLDPKGASEMMSIFKTLNKDYQKTIILVTHDNELVYDFADEVVLLDGGEVKAKLKCEDFFSDQTLIDTYKIVLPKIVALRNMLKEKGFKGLDEVRDIEELVERVVDFE